MRLESYPSWKEARKTRKPLRSAVELAKELKLSMAQLRGYLAADGAPKPEISFHGKSYYEPIAFIRWFRRAH